MIILGISMMMNGLSTIGVAPISQKKSKVNSASGINKPIIEDGYQLVRIDVNARRYEDIVVQKGIPVKFILDVAPGALSGCNYAINIPAYDVFKMLEEGENVIEFNPVEEGIYPYSCWMGMIRNTITVIDGDIEKYIEDYVPKEDDRNLFKAYESSGFGRGSCH